jgi:hypothetical protein
MLNPFRYGIIVDEPFFIDREDEQKDIYQWLSTKQSIVLYSPRRYGKSSQSSLFFSPASAFFGVLGGK